MLAWIYALLVATGAAVAAAAGSPWGAVALAALVVGVLMGSRFAWLVAVLSHVSVVLGVMLLAVWPWTAASWALVLGDIIAVAILLAPSMRLDRSMGERAPRGSC